MRRQCPILALAGMLGFAAPAMGALNLQVSVTPTSASAVPANISYSVGESDPTADLTNVYWDFGDGGRSLTKTGQYTYISPGTYAVQVWAEDTIGGISHGTATVTISDPGFVNLSLASPPSDSYTTSSDTLSMSGQAPASTQVYWSTDRGEAGLAAGTATFSASVPLHPGRNRLLVNAYAAGGAMTRAERIVLFNPADPLSIVAIVPPAGPVQQYEPAVIQFDVANTRATVFDWPYEPTPPMGVPAGLGITVNGEFSDDNFATALVQPAFYYQPYSFQTIGNKDWLSPSGAAHWTVRFAPPRPGTWQYRLTATDAGGNVVSPVGSFAVAPPTDATNHGLVRVNPRDSRYFAFGDGTDFLGIGHNETYTDVTSFSTYMDGRATVAGNDAVQFMRIWMSTSSIFGAAWTPLNSATLPYSGYLPATGLQSDQAYGDGIFSVRLDAATNPCMFYGWMGGDCGLQSGHAYRIRIRVKLSGVTGPSRTGYAYGFTVKRTGWPSPPDFFPTISPVIGYRTGSLDWAVLEGSFTAGGSFLGDLSFVLENCTAGTAWLDEISIREVQIGGTLGMELNRRPKMNHHTCFDQLASWQYDRLLDRARQNGCYYRVVLTDKDDYILSRIGVHGFPLSSASPTCFDGRPGSAGYTWQSYWWRYVTARWGAQRSVHSWELANEQDPWNASNYAHAQDLAAWMHAHDPTGRDALTSFWTDFPATQFWKNAGYPDVRHADVHAYLFANTPENNDTAYAHLSLGRSLAAQQIGKPIVRGETGIVGSGDEDVAVKQDTTGVWLRHLTWSQLDANGMYELYWFTKNIRGENVGHGNLYDIFRAYRKFMADIPLGNGHYADAGATSSDAHVRVVGQVDHTNNRGHLWMQHTDYTWRNVVNAVTVTPVTSTITIPNMAARSRYRLTWFDTRTGLPTTSQEILLANTTVLSFVLTDFASDVALKVERVEQMVRSDFDLDGDVDQEDFGHLQACLTGPRIAQNAPECQDALLDDDIDVDLDDFYIFQRCYCGPNVSANPQCEH